MTSSNHKQIPEPGDIVKCNYNFDEEREKYELPYPKKGDYLIVKECLRDPTAKNYYLFFKDVLPSVPLALKRFDLVQDEADGDAVLNEAYKIANNL